MTTIFAPITAQAASSVLVIRISGIDAVNSLRIFGFQAKIIPKQSTFSKIFDPQNGEVIDEVLFTYFQAPNSFTGEDIVEISTHSSAFIFKKVCEILLSQPNFRFAEAGEFSKRAFLNGKIDLVQAEAIPDLINSETEAQHRQAINQLQGKLGKIYENWRFKIIEILAMMTALIDFPEEDVPPEVFQKIFNEVRFLHDEIASHLNDNRAGQKIKNGIMVAIIGAPNVGKSSLLNFLADSEVAIVSENAGTTRDVIETRLQIAGIPVIFADTAGIRQSIDPIEKEGIRRAIKKAKEADIKLLVVDATQVSFDGLEFDEKTILLVNKVDKLTKQFLPDDFLQLIPERDCGKIIDLIPISVLSGDNISRIFASLEQQIKTIVPNQNSSFLTQERYRHHLTNSLAALNQVSLEKNIELLAEDLRVAAQEISKISGKIDIENILDSVFSNFCIGK